MTDHDRQTREKNVRPENPFFPGWRRYRDAEHDFRHFKLNVEGQIANVVREIPDFAALEAHAGFYTDMGTKTTVQASFGTHLMRRLTLKDEPASESGAALVYSFGPTGWISIMLFPPVSDIGRIVEDHIYLFIGRISAARLFERLPSDLRDLVRYERVASLDTAPRIGERLRIAWLRYWSRMQINGQTKAARSSEHLGTAVEFSSGKLAASLIGAMLKPVGTLIIILLLIKFGLPELVRYLAPATGLPAQALSGPSLPTH